MWYSVSSWTPVIHHHLWFIRYDLIGIVEMKSNLINFNTRGGCKLAVNEIANDWVINKRRCKAMGKATNHLFVIYVKPCLI